MEIGILDNLEDCFLRYVRKMIDESLAEGLWLVIFTEYHNRGRNFEACGAQVVLTPQLGGK